MSLTVAPGETVAIVGSSGGKSTLCQLIPRFYDVSSGSISIDGQDIRDVTQRSIHENIGIVQQDVFLFADTILENIRHGKPDATMEQVIDAAKKAEIYDDIQAMPDGFNTYVGAAGYTSSGGQKQRIAIARIFLKTRPSWILDEATSRAGLRDGGEKSSTPSTSWRRPAGRPDHRPPLTPSATPTAHHLDFRRRHHGMRHPRRAAQKGGIYARAVPRRRMHWRWRRSGSKRAGRIEAPFFNMLQKCNHRLPKCKPHVVYFQEELKWRQKPQETYRRKLVSLEKAKRDNTDGTGRETECFPSGDIRWEVGLAVPTTDNLKVLSELYGVSIDNLLNDAAENVSKQNEVKQDQSSASETEEKNGFRNRREMVHIGAAIGC